MCFNIVGSDDLYSRLGIPQNGQVNANNFFAANQQPLNQGGFGDFFGERFGPFLPRANQPVLNPMAGNPAAGQNINLFPVRNMAPPQAGGVLSAAQQEGDGKAEYERHPLVPEELARLGVKWRTPEEVKAECERHNDAMIKYLTAQKKKWRKAEREEQERLDIEAEEMRKKGYNVTAQSVRKRELPWWLADSYEIASDTSDEEEYERRREEKKRNPPKFEPVTKEEQEEWVKMIQSLDEEDSGDNITQEELERIRRDMEERRQQKERKFRRKMRNYRPPEESKNSEKPEGACGTSKDKQKGRCSFCEGKQISKYMVIRLLIEISI